MSAVALAEALTHTVKLQPATIFLRCSLIGAQRCAEMLVSVADLSVSLIDSKVLRIFIPYGTDAARSRSLKLHQQHSCGKGHILGLSICNSC